MATFSQTFTRITDASNPIIADGGPLEYSGASWVDFDNDNDLDLFVNNDKLYRNDGNGVFVKLATTLGNGQPIIANQIIGNGNSWADYDNDGDLDCFISSATSFLYRNDGNSIFTKITSGAIGNGSANRGWACAWADYNNDGYVDLAITHPANFVAGGATPNHLLRNDGPPNYTFTKITTGPIVTGLAAYTVGTWSDFDSDGDMDYFIGAGPANGTTSPDYLYRNLLKESGSANFERITSGVMATDQQDGQVWNWIDYDNDGDLDAYLTNWGGPLGGLANRLYRNDNGTFTRLTADPIVTDVGISLSSVWGDFDNDGDLDCYVANDGNQADSYYRNNGNGSFTGVTNIVIASTLTHRGATAGDYDNDGDLDLLAVGPAAALALYRNDTPSGNHWLGLSCIGTTSNRTAISTKLRVKATINGHAIWQLREISAQNTFNGHNSLRQHFGLGNATMIDSLKIEWPSGLVEIQTNIAADQFLTMTEGIVSVVDDTDAPTSLTAFALHQNYPNPFNPSTIIGFSLPRATVVELIVFDLAGREVMKLASGFKSAGKHELAFEARHLSSGVYVYRLRTGDFVQSQKMILLR
ncbi:MAG: FG-GAP-like repeat-containing protein [bacterium]